MAKKKGICTLCGRGGKLTFEHIPPECAYNLPGVEMFGFDEWRARDPETGAMVGGQPQPKGTGLHALCETCNPALGTWYVNAFRDFATAGMSILEDIRPQLGELDADPHARFLTVTLRGIDRLLIVKQIVSMLVITSGRDAMAKHPALLDFVLSPAAQGLPSEYRVFLAFSAGPALCRSSGFCVRVDSAGEAFAFSEFTYMPWAYGLSYNGKAVYPAGEITDWASAVPGPTDVAGLRVLLGFTHTALPGVLQSRGAMERRTRGERDL